MKECPICHNLVEDAATSCPRCGHAFELTFRAIEAREQAELARAAQELVQEVVELKRALPTNQPIVVIQNIIKGSFNDIGDKTYGERGAGVLKFPEVQAGTERAFAQQETEKQAQGDSLRAAHLAELYQATDRQWKEEVLRRLQDFGEQLVQRFDQASQLSQRVGEQLGVQEAPSPTARQPVSPKPAPPAPKPAAPPPKPSAPKPAAPSAPKPAPQPKPALPKPPAPKPVEEVFEKYTSTYDALSGRFVSLPDTDPNTQALKEAVQRTDESFPDWWAVEVAARRLQDTDPARADAIYAKGLEQFPMSAPLLGNYAIFLTDVRKDYERAEEHFRRSLAADPNDADHLGNYAIFLKNIRKDYDRAEEHYRRALAADPNDGDTLSNYANFLTNIRKDYEGAEEHYRRALAAGPNDATILGSYAVFLNNIRKDYEGAEENYRRALAADPNDAKNLGNYAGFLLARGRSKEGLSALEKVLRLPEVSDGSGLAAECWFYALAHRSPEGRAEALRNLKRVLVAGERSPVWNLAPNIAQARQDGHPDVLWLEKLAAVISYGAYVGILEAWTEWKEA